MDQWFRVLGKLGEGPASVPSTCMASHNHLCITLVPGDTTPSLGLHGHQTHTCCTCTHKNKYKLIFIIKTIYDFIPPNPYFGVIFFLFKDFC